MARLHNADRKVTYGSSGQCNYELAPGWFNFKGTAGKRMASSCQPNDRCGTVGQKGLTYKKSQKGLRRS